MNDTNALLCHFLAALAYRTQKCLRGAPEGFGTFRAADGVRTPSELVRHMTSVLGYARTLFDGGRYWPDPLPSLADEVLRFHAMLESLAGRIRANDVEACPVPVSADVLLQGPFADAMTHVGQLGMLRRLAGAPVAPENFVRAQISADRLGVEQPDPASPDAVWPEAPPGWVPPKDGYRP